MAGTLQGVVFWVFVRMNTDVKRLKPLILVPEADAFHEVLLVASTLVKFFQQLTAAVRVFR